jgi:hypothetical protein
LQSPPPDAEVESFGVGGEPDELDDAGGFVSPDDAPLVAAPGPVVYVVTVVLYKFPVAGSACV